jgi:hypothetical protein
VIALKNNFSTALEYVSAVHRNILVEVEDIIKLYWRVLNGDLPENSNVFYRISP